MKREMGFAFSQQILLLAFVTSLLTTEVQTRVLRPSSVNQDLISAEALFRTSKRQSEGSGACRLDPRDCKGTFVVPRSRGDVGVRTRLRNAIKRAMVGREQ